MGCGVSRLDGNGMVLPVKLRPLFLYRLEEIKTRRHARPLKISDSTPSKKELLLHDHDRDDDEKSSSSENNAPNKTMPFSPKEKVNHEEQASENNHEEKKGEYGKNDVKEKKIEDVKAKDKAEVEEGTLTDAEIDGCDLTDDEDDERMIGHDDDGAFRGSPSFRVYFKDNGEDKHNDNIGHENDAFKNEISSAEAESSKESSENKKVMKRGGKRKSFRNKVLPKGGQGAIKNLLNYKSCYNATPSSGHDQTLLLTGKTTA